MAADEKARDVLQHAEGRADHAMPLLKNTVPADNTDDNTDDNRPGRRAESADLPQRPGESDTERHLQAVAVITSNPREWADYVAWAAKKLHDGERIRTSTTKERWTGRTLADGSGSDLNNNHLPTIHRMLIRDLIRKGEPRDKAMKLVEFRKSPCNWFFPDLFPECSEVDRG